MRRCCAARHPAAANDRNVAEVRREMRDFQQPAAASFTAMRSVLTDLQTEMGTGFTRYASNWTTSLRASNRSPACRTC